MAPKDPVERKKEKMLAEADAGLSMSPEEHQRLMGWIALRLAMERHASLAAAERVRRDEADEERRRHIEHPYGIPALLHGHDPERVYADARAKADAAVAYKESKEERDDALEEELANARNLTLGLAHEVSNLLFDEGVYPDTEVRSFRTHKEREWQGWKQFLLKSGHARPEVEKRRYTHEATGWLLQFPMSARAHGSVVLCEDGRLLAVDGITRHPEPGQLTYREGPGVAGYIDETPGPDIAAPPLIAKREKSFYAHTVDMLSREAMIQDALVGLLIANGVELPTTPGPAMTT